MQNATGSVGICLLPSEREDLRDLINEQGERLAADALDLSRMSLSRACAGLPLRRSTARIIRAALADRRKAG